MPMSPVRTARAGHDVYGRLQCSQCYWTSPPCTRLAAACWDTRWPHAPGQRTVWETQTEERLCRALDLGNSSFGASALSELAALLAGMPQLELCILTMVRRIHEAAEEERLLQVPSSHLANQDCAYVALLVQVLSI